MYLGSLNSGFSATIRRQGKVNIVKSWMTVLGVSLASTATIARGTGIDIEAAMSMLKQFPNPYTSLDSKTNIEIV